ncbi:MAG: glutaredoxin 3 [Chromatiales bacterium]|nr:glutaredoxin 3 [Gammaproteobacteria bacterium]MBW6477472.1 glutaredoxin 3 [Chromatiales bacterium]
MSQVVMYSTASCPYCVRARQLLEKKGVDYTDIRIDQQPTLRPEMERLSGRSSVPQIFIGEFHVGGFDDLAELDVDGELDERLGLS